MIKDSDTWECANFMVSSDHNSKINPNTSKSTAHMFIEHGEIKKEAPKSDSLSDNLSVDHTENLWPDELKDLELSYPSMGLLSHKMGSNNEEDVVSLMFSFRDQTCSTSTSHSLEVDHDFVDKSIDFGNFEFDETVFPLGSV